MTSAGISYFPTRWFVNKISSSTMCFSDKKVISNLLHTPPFWLNIVLDVPKLKFTQTHIPHNYTSQIIFFVLFTFSVRVNNPWPNAIFFFESPKLSLSYIVSLIVLISQWMLKWSKKVSLRSVSSTNYPTSHRPQLSIFFFYMFTNFMQPNITIYKGYKIKYTQHLYILAS